MLRKKNNRACRMKQMGKVRGKQNNQITDGEGGEEEDEDVEEEAAPRKEVEEEEEKTGYEQKPRHQTKF